VRRRLLVAGWAVSTVALLALGLPVRTQAAVRRVCPRGVMVFQTESTLLHDPRLNASECKQPENNDWDAGFAGIATAMLDKAARSDFQIVLFSRNAQGSSAWDQIQRGLTKLRPKLFTAKFFRCSAEHWHSTEFFSINPAEDKREGMRVCGDGGSMYHSVTEGGLGRDGLLTALQRVSHDWSLSSTGCVVYFDGHRGAVESARLAGFGGVLVQEPALHIYLKTNLEMLGRQKRVSTTRRLLQKLRASSSQTPGSVIRNNGSCGLTDMAQFAAGMRQLQEQDACLGMPTLQLEMIGVGVAGMMFEVAQLIMLSMFVFLGVAIATRDYLIVCIQSVCSDVGAAKRGRCSTFFTSWLMALGCAAPEVTISFIGALRGTISVGMATVFGSAFIAFTLIPGISGLASTDPQPLNAIPYLRDTSCFLFILLLLLYQLDDGVLGASESILLVALQPIYYVSILLHRDFQKYMYGGDTSSIVDDKTPLLGAKQRQYKEEPTKPQAAAQTEVTENAKHGEVPQPFETLCSKDTSDAGIMERLVNMFAAPYRFIYRYTIPKPTSNMLILTVIMVFLYVGLLSYALLTLMEKFSCVVGVPISVAGVTLIALGSQVPDILSGYWMGQHGLLNEALSWSVSSQVANLCLGVGVPGLIWVVTTGSGMVVPRTDLRLYLWTLSIAIVIYVLVLSIPALAPSSVASLNHRPALGRFNGGVLVVTYLLCIFAVAWKWT